MDVRVVPKPYLMSVRHELSPTFFFYQISVFLSFRFKIYISTIEYISLKYVLCSSLHDITISLNANILIKKNKFVIYLV